MKAICLVVLGLLAGTASAAPDAPEQPLTVKYLKEYAVAVATGYCNVITQPHAPSVVDTPQVDSFDASNADLHRCQYVHEMSATDCMQTSSCPDYESWTQANPTIAPTQPREVFLSALKTRKTRNLSQ